MTREAEIAGYVTTDKITDDALEGMRYQIERLHYFAERADDDGDLLDDIAHCVLRSNTALTLDTPPCGLAADELIVIALEDLRLQIERLIDLAAGIDDGGLHDILEDVAGELIRSEMMLRLVLSKRKGKGSLLDTRAQSILKQMGFVLN